METKLNLQADYLNLGPTQGLSRLNDPHLLIKKKQKKNFANYVFAKYQNFV